MQVPGVLISTAVSFFVLRLQPCARVTAAVLLQFRGQDHLEDVLLEAQAVYPVLVLCWLPALRAQAPVAVPIIGALMRRKGESIHPPPLFPSPPLLRRERPREGKGKGRGKVRAGRKRKVKGR